LDNVVYRLGFASSRNQARQLVTHRHFKVNGRNVNIPSFMLKAGDIVEIKEKAKEIPQIMESITRMEGKGIPPWLELDMEKFRGRLVHIPTKEEIALPIQEQLVVELYSK